MININEQDKRVKYQKMIDDLTRITQEIVILDKKTKTCKNLLKENLLIDNKIFDEERFTSLEGSAGNVLSNINDIIIPNLMREMNQ